MGEAQRKLEEEELEKDARIRSEMESSADDSLFADEIEKSRLSCRFPPMPQ